MPRIQPPVIASHSSLRSTTGYAACTKRMPPTCDELAAPNNRASRRRFMGSIVALFVSCSLLLSGQTNGGELRLKVTDPSGLAVKTSVEIISEANQYRRVLTTD